MKGYKHFGVMLDCSRNAVMKPAVVKKLIDYLKKFGYNTLELYTEDTFRPDGEPYFGYLRGGYTGADIREIDAYAAARGVELIPCIQTLAHFTNLVKLPAYGDIVDTADILLIDEEKTYALLDKLFAFAAENFTSRYINIGMDEAHMVGLGKYLDKHGYVDRFDLLVRHLARVAEIAKKYGFKPHMWSDMFFRLGNHGEYYGKGLHVAKEVREKVPDNVDLIYWDYYHADEEMYDEMFASHKEFANDVWFAGGAWCWNGFAPFHTFSMQTMKPAMKSVAKNGIENVLITMWGDNGKECSSFAVLPALYAIRQYADGNFDEEKIARGFEEATGIPYADFVRLELPNATRGSVAGTIAENPAKCLLYSDCFLGIFDRAAEAEGKIPFADYAAALSDSASRAGEFAYLFETLASLCSVMELKGMLGVRTRAAYRSGDKKAVCALLPDYEETLVRLKDFYARFKGLWFKENRPFGWEVQEARLGGLMLRIRSCADRLRAYAEGETDRIEELEEDILPFGEQGLECNFYRNIVIRSEL